MKRTQVLIFAATVMTAGVASAQFPPANVPQADVPGVPSGDPTDTPNEAYFTTSASIDSVFVFDVSNSTVDCGAVSYQDTNPTTCVDTAAFTVESNNNWQVTINDGLSYDADPGLQNFTLLTNNDLAYAVGSMFNFDLVATNDTDSSNVVTTAQAPTAATDVTVTASYATSVSNVQDDVAVDPTDGKGEYEGAFVVTIYEP